MRKKTGRVKRSGARSQAFLAGSMPVSVRLDAWIMVPVLLLLSAGIIMVGSASISSRRIRLEGISRASKMILAPGEKPVPCTLKLIFAPTSLGPDS